MNILFRQQTHMYMWQQQGGGVMFSSYEYFYLFAHPIKYKMAQNVL